MFATMEVHTKCIVKSSQQLRKILLWCRPLFPVEDFSDITIQKSSKARTHAHTRTHTHTHTHTNTNKSTINFQVCIRYTFDLPCAKILHSCLYFRNLLLTLLILRMS